MPILNSITEISKEMTEWRQHLHQNPELGLEEHKTSKYIKDKLKLWNIEYKSGFANTGILAWVKGNKGNSDKSIGLRADMDALPMPEDNVFEHKSKNEGIMHACGHDGHTSMLLGATKYFHLSAKLDGPTPTVLPSAFARCASSDTERYSHLLERHCAMGPVVNSLRHPGNIYIEPSFLYRTIYLSLFQQRTVW